MKTLHYFFSCFILILLISCKQADAVATETDFSFYEQQPINDNRISHFPRNIIGNYIDKDSTYLIVTDKHFIYKWVRKSNMSFEDFEKIKDSFSVIGTRIYYLKENFCEFRRLKDSIEITSTNFDTIFSLSQNQIAKKIRNSLVLNTNDSIFWKIKIVNFDKNILKIKTLATFEDLNRIDSLSNSKVQKNDSTRNVIQLSVKEFKRMLKLKNFGYDQVFKKIN